MQIKKQLQDVLGGTLGVAGMIISLVHGDKKGATSGDLPASGKVLAREKPPVAKGGTKKAEAKHPVAVKKKRAEKPVAAGKATTARATGNEGAVAQATRAEQAAFAVPAKGGKKATTIKGATPI